MKKLSVIIVAIVLLAGVGGVYAYAQSTHQPMEGQKLIGWGAFGKGSVNEIDECELFYTRFFITNPDCVNQITIERILVIKSDASEEWTGSILDPVTGQPLTGALGPHQSGVIDLASCLLFDPEDIPYTEAYTVEVFWTGAKGGLPLTGWSWMATGTINESTGEWIEDVVTTSTSQMVNMEQELIKSK